MPKDFHYTVEGEWPFPADMLRRDSSQPASPADVDLVARLTRDHCDDRDDLSKSTVHLVIPDAGRWRPNAKRWESFGWKVVDDEEDDRRKALVAREVRLMKLRDSALSKLTNDEKNALAWFFGSQIH